MRSAFLPLVLLVAAMPSPAHSGQTGALTIQAKNTQPHVELYQGGTGAEAGISAYSSIVWGFGQPLNAPGWRVKANARYGRHESRVAIGPERLRVDKTYEAASYDLLLGYQANYRFLWLKLYAGASYRHESDSLEGLPVRHNENTGALAAIETWWRLGEKDWASLDASWSGIGNGVSVFSRLGRDVQNFTRGPVIALGIEAAFHREEESPVAEKAGPFLQARWERHEVTLSGGLSRDDEREWQPFGSLSYGRKF